MLAAVVADELKALQAEFDAVICEGAGSPAEINLRATDLANMGLARAANLPVIVVGDIDRGGLLAHLFGTVAILAPEDQALSRASWSTSFAATRPCSRPGLTQLEKLTGRPTYGVVPSTTASGSTRRTRCRCWPIVSSASRSRRSASSG